MPSRLLLLLALLLVLAAPTRGADAPFLLQVEDVFQISGRGTVVTGKVVRGAVKQGDPVELVGLGPTRKVTVTGVEMFRKTVAEAKAGDLVGLLLRGVTRDEVRRGQVLARPGSIAACTRFRGRIDMLPSADGGRRTPFVTGYRPQLQVWGADVTATVTLPSSRESVAPGDKGVLVDVEFAEPVALEKGGTFAVREGGRTVGSGTVLELGK